MHNFDELRNQSYVNTIAEKQWMKYMVIGFYLQILNAEPSFVAVWSNRMVTTRRKFFSNSCEK